MRNSLLLFILFIATSNGNAQYSQLLINENFTDYTTGNLNSTSASQGSWKPSFRESSSDFVQVASLLPLLYPDYTSGSQYVNVAQRSDYEASPWKYPDDPYKPFKNGMIATNADNTIFYISFLVRVPSAGGVQSTGDARPNIALRTINGSQFANFYIGKTQNGTGLKFGINKDTYGSGQFTEQTYSFNTTYLVLIRYDIANGLNTGDYDDKMYLWINPSLSSEPSGQSAQVAINNFWDFKFDGGFNTPAHSLQLFQEPGSATASFDAFKVAYAQGFDTDTATSAAAWNALSPAGVPLPVKFGSIKGYAKDRGIQVEWNVYSEFNLLRYEVERSADCIHFSHAAYVAVKDEESKSLYKWLDAIPFGGNNYYRIKNIYTTGEPLYSTIVRVVLKEHDPVLLIYPNPVSDKHISIQATELQQGDYKIEIFNAGGQLLYIKQISAGNTLHQPIELPAALKTGIYTIQLTGMGIKQATQFLVK